MNDPLDRPHLPGIEWLTRLRFGPGIVNKLGTGFVALMFLFGVAILRVRSDVLVILLMAGAVGCAFYFMRKILTFAERHPGPPFWRVNTSSRVADRNSTPCADVWGTMRPATILRRVSTRMTA